MGYYTGKLIGIEVIFMFQMTFFALLTIDDLSPTFNALSHLKYSRGYNHPFFETEFLIRKNFYPVDLQLEFLNNYNIVFSLVFFPAFTALILLIVNYLCYQNNHETLQKYEALLIG